MPSPLCPPFSPSMPSFSKTPRKSRFRSNIRLRLYEVSTPKLPDTPSAFGESPTCTHPSPTYGLTLHALSFSDKRRIMSNITSACRFERLNSCSVSQYPYQGFPLMALPLECAPFWVAPLTGRPLYIRRTPMPEGNHCPTAMSKAGEIRSPNLSWRLWSPKYICAPAPTLTKQLFQKRSVSASYLSLLYSTVYVGVVFVSVCEKTGMAAASIRAAMNILFLVILFLIRLLVIHAQHQFSVSPCRRWDYR